MPARISMIFMLFFSLFLFACGSDAEKAKDEEKTVADVTGEVNKTAQKLTSGEIGIDEAMSQMQQMMSGGDKVTPVDFRKLKALLPESIKGLQRSNLEGEKTGGFGIMVSTARADYKNSAGRLTINITDLGTMKGMAAMATAAWLHAEIDRESEDEFEQTFELRGNKAFKKYNKHRQRGEIGTIIASRFIVNVKGRGFPFARLEEALDEISFNELEKLKDEGIR